MPNGFGRGRGSGFGSRGGMGLGFRGSSPPWPYVGLGRGGLPRCGYTYPGATPSVYPPMRSRVAPYTPSSGPTSSREEELGHLKNEAQAIKERLDGIESRMRDLDTKEA
jgi:hypothetical protein